MVKAMRSALEHAFYETDRSRKPVDHAGVLLDYYMRSIESGDKPDLKELYSKVVTTRPPTLYQHAFKRWRMMHEANSDHTATRVIASDDRIVVGLGADSVREVGITLHRAYGVPIIPGSALKGLARAYLRWWSRNDAGLSEDDCAALTRTIFGDQDIAGYVAWHDAWYVPGSLESDQPLALDVLAPHHRGYYTGDAKKRAWPSDFDDPNPVNFLSARGSYFVALTGPDRDWADRAMEILTFALEEWGIGGKTSSGYGQMTTIGSAVSSAASGSAAITPQAETEPALLREIKSLPLHLVPSQINEKIGRARQLEEPYREAALRAIREKIVHPAVSRKWRRDKGKDLINVLDAELEIEETDD